MSRKRSVVRGFVIGVIVAAAVGISWYAWHESRRSKLEKAAEKSANWASETTDKVAEKTKSLFQ